MAAVIRLKRLLEEEPSETLILNCKKRKTDANADNETSEVSTILKFAGTINKQEDIYTHLKKPSKVELEEQFKKHNVDLSAKLRTQRQLDVKKNRYKVVNCYRSKASNDAQKEVSQSDFTIYDIENETAENQDAGTKYVYDVYYTASDDLGDAEVEEYVNLYNDNFMYGSMRDNGINQSDSEDDSEDSNCEKNWKNDYPDESDVESITEDDMVQAMKKCDLSDLSSDDGEEGFVYSIDSEAAGFEEDIDDSDVQRYGERYARFKARNKREESSGNHDLYYGDIDEDEYYY